MAAPSLLPAGVRLVHIGPHKTGTTAVQWALHESRSALAEQGVRYAGSTSQAYLPALGLTGLSGRIGGPQASEADWEGLVEEVRSDPEARVVMSSESFANADPVHIARLRDDLGADRVHVVRMLRRYDKMLPSQWQQQVSGGGRRSYDAYLDAVAADLDHAFWRRHGFVGLTRRWAEVVGPDRVGVVVVNESDRGWLLHVFEELLGLRPGTLVAPAGRENRSLTFGEVEVLRHLNAIRQRQGWVDRVHFQFVRRGVSLGLRTLPADPDDGRITLPSAYDAMVAEATRRDIRNLSELGVDVVGDLDWLRPAAGGEDLQPPTVGVRSAAAAATAVVRRHLEGVGFRLGGSTGAPERRRRKLDPAEQELVELLKAEEWPAAVEKRFVDEGLVPWLLGQPKGDAPAGRLEPRRAAAAVAGVIARTES